MSDVVQKQLERARDFLASIPDAAEEACARALNRAATIGREQAIDSIDKRYAVHPSDVREKISLRAANKNDLTISIVSRSGPLALGYFPHTPIKSGTGGRGMPILRAEVIRGQEREVVGAFIAPINGNPRIMVRTGGKTATGKSAIKSLASVPIANMLGAASVREAVIPRAIAVFEEQLDREMDRALGKAA